jgi:hypothetical protein
VLLRWPATASTKLGANEVENCRLGRNRHKPVSSNQVHASSRVSAPFPLWRIRSARAASNCSDVKEEPLFQTCVAAPLVDAVPSGLFKGRPAFCKVRRLSCAAPGCLCPLGRFTPGFPPPEGRDAACPLRIRYGGRPAGSLSKNTAKRLDVHAGSLLGTASSQVPTIATPYVRGQEGYSP